MQNLKYLLLLGDATLLHYMQPRDLFQLSLSCKDMLSLIQSKDFRAGIKQLYFSYYGPVLTMIRIPDHPYLGFQSAEDLKYLFTSALCESNALVSWLRADDSSSDLSPLYKDTAGLLKQYLGDDRMELRTYLMTYEQYVSDDILCISDDFYADAVRRYFRMACDQNITSAANPRWKVLRYGYLYHVLRKFSHYYLFCVHCESHLLNDLGAKLEQFFQFRMPPEGVRCFIKQISANVGEEYEEYFDTGLKYLASLGYQYESYVNDAIFEQVQSLLDSDECSPSEHYDNRVENTAYSRLLIFGYYGYETEYRDIDNVSDTDIYEHDSSPRICLRSPIEKHLAKSCYDKLIQFLSDYARRHPINGERAALIIALLGHVNKLLDPENIYIILMKEAFEKSDDADFALLLYKLVRYCKWTKYKLEDIFIYVMFGQKTDYQKKVFSMVNQHIVSGDYWDLLEITVELCGPLEQYDALSLLYIIYNSLSNTRSDIWTNSMDQEYLCDVESAQQGLEQNLQKYCSLLGGADTVRQLLNNLGGEQCQYFSMEYLAQSVKFCEPQQTEQQAELASVVAQQFKDRPRLIAQLLKCFRSNQIRHDIAWEKLDAICTTAQIAQVCQAVGPELCRKLGIDNSQRDHVLKQLHDLTDNRCGDSATTYNKLLQCSSQSVLRQAYGGNFYYKSSEAVDELICKVIEGTIKAFGADAALFISVFKDEIFIKSSPILRYYLKIVLDQLCDNDIMLEVEFQAVISSCKAYILSKPLEMRQNLCGRLQSSVNGVFELLSGQFISDKLGRQIDKISSSANALVDELKYDPLYQEMIRKQQRQRHELDSFYESPGGTYFPDYGEYY
ncbi:hypothetical protein MP228_003031 [Amoeboaphelidium protococcarum]|nr:hypothetical protein MP228_003031 [Amoeboaphelidium protococcarum]